MQNAVAVIAVVFVLIPGVWWVSLTRLAAARADASDSWTDVDAELQRRYDLTRALVDAVGTASDPDLIAELVDRTDDAADAPRTPNAANEFEPPLVEAIDQVLAMREHSTEYDDGNHGAQLHEQLAAADDRVTVAGSFYNTRVEHFHRRIESFPSGLVARRHGFYRGEYFDI